MLCKKFNIRPTQYAEWIAGLKAKGFTQQQSHCVMFKRCSGKAVATLISQCDALLAHSLQLTDLVRIASHKGGSRNIAAVEDNLVSLVDAGLNVDEVVQIAVRSIRVYLCTHKVSQHIRRKHVSSAVAVHNPRAYSMSCTH